METIILDTETTGLSYSDEIIEIGICDLKGNVLFDKRIKPSKNNTRWPDAERIHGITPDDVKDCRTFPEIYQELASILSGKNVVIFNAGYDTKLLRQSCANWLLDPKILLDNNFTCCMYAAGSRWPEYANYYGGMSLDQALCVSGCKRIGEAHSAIGDALSTAEVWKKILIAP